MKRLSLLFAVAVLISNAAYSQTKIKDGSVTGSSSLPHGGAVLELESSDRGLLFPRVKLTTTSTWGLSGTAIAGMTIYNESAAVTSSDPNYPIIAGGIGQYYFDGTGWVGTKPSGGNFWSLTGNTGTDPLTNFLGTTDSKPLRFKANNLFSGYIGLASYPGGGSQDLNTTFGYGAGGDIVGRMVATQAYRKMTAIGYMALGGGTFASGSNLTENTAVGFEAGRSLQGTSHRNTLIGSVAAAAMNQGTLNTIVGQGALFGATGGNNNVIVGQGAGGEGTGSPSNNTFLGTQAGLKNGGTGNILLGHQAGYNYTGDNRLMIHNTQSDSPLLDGDLVNGILKINKTLKVAESAAIGTTATPARTLHIVPAAGAATSLRIEGVPSYDDNAAATTAGLQVGDVYRTGDLLKIVH